MKVRFTKSVLFLAVVFAPYAQAVTVQAELPRNLESECGDKKMEYRSRACCVQKKDCKACRPITKRNFCQNGTLSKTVVINKSGKYCLCESIPFNPQNKNDHAIIIDADDVILDLCGFTLEQVSDVTSIIGIKVLTGHENVTILGSYGAIKNFSQLGIQIQGGTQDITIGDSTQLDINGCGHGTPLALIDAGVPQFQGGMNAGETEYWAIQGYPPVQGTIENFKMRNVNLDHNTLGMFLGNISNGDFKGCSISYNVEDRILGTTIFGPSVFVGNGIFNAGLLFYGMEILGDGVDSFNIEDCKFNHNEAKGNENLLAVAILGFSINGTKGLRIRNSQFNNNIASGAFLFSSSRGFSIGAGNCTTFDNCEFCGNMGGIGGEGFHQSGFLDSPDGIIPFELLPVRSLTLRNCVASGNAANSELSEANVGVFPFQAHGFLQAYNTGTTMIDCVAEDNKVIAQDQFKDILGFADGIFIAGTSDTPDTTATNLDIRGFHANRNTTNTTAPGSTSIGIEIVTNFVQNISISNAVITQHTLFEDPGGRFEIGIDAFTVGNDTPTLITIKDSIISNNGRFGIFLQDQPQANVQGNEISEHSDVGVFLVNSICSNIVQNTLLNNFIGVWDVDNPSTSLVAQNKAFNNGTGYIVDYPFGPVPVRSGDFDTGFPSDAEICDNVDITKEAPAKSPAIRSHTPAHLDTVQDRPKREALMKKIMEKMHQMIAEDESFNLSDEEIDSFVHFVMER